MITALLMFGGLTGFFVVVAGARLFSRRQPTENVEGSGGAQS